MKKRTLLSLLAVLMLAGSWTGLYAQDKVVKKIIETGTTDNKAMEHADWLANRIGGRIVGSPALTHAEAWVKEQFESWGLEVMVQEAGEINVGFYRGPWYGRMLSEDGMALHFGTPAYTSGTKGKQTGPVFIEPKNQREFDRMKGSLKGSWILLNKTSNGLQLAGKLRHPLLPGYGGGRDCRFHPFGQASAARDVRPGPLLRSYHGNPSHRL